MSLRYAKRSRHPSPSPSRSPHKDTHHHHSCLSNKRQRQFHHHHPSPHTSHYTPHTSQHSASSRSSEVKNVNDTLGKGNYEGFIKYYVEQHDSLYDSLYKKNVHGTQTFFNNFIETCRRCLLTNQSYYTPFIEKKGDKEYGRCIPIENGPTKQYIDLLIHIVKNAEKYDKPTAKKIHRLLFWFEQQSIAYIIVTEYDPVMANLFSTYGKTRGYRGEEDGTMSYCSLIGSIHKDGGMEISNTRVNALLNKIHKLGDNSKNPIHSTDSGGRRSCRGIRSNIRSISARKGTQSNIFPDGLDGQRSDEDTPPGRHRMGTRKNRITTKRSKKNKHRRTRRRR
jgi:hypothetical protein